MAQDTVRDAASGVGNTVIFAPDSSKTAIAEFLRNQESFKV